MESNSKMLAKALTGCGQFVNHRRVMRHRAPLTGAALRKQALIVWNAVTFQIKLGRLRSASYAA